MTTGRINQVAAMRPPMPIVGHRRAIDEITKHDRLAWFHSFRQSTNRLTTIRENAAQLSASDSASKLANFPFAFQAPVAGLE